MEEGVDALAAGSASGSFEEGNEPAQAEEAEEAVQTGHNEGVETTDHEDDPPTQQKLFVIRSRPQNRSFPEPALLHFQALVFADPAAGALKGHCGFHDEIQTRLQNHPAWPCWLGRTHRLLKAALGCEDTVVVDAVCHRGRHRSVAITQIIGWLVAQDSRVRVVTHHYSQRELCRCDQCSRPEDPRITQETWAMWSSFGPLV